MQPVAVQVHVRVHGYGFHNACSAKQAMADWSVCDTLMLRAHPCMWRKVGLAGPSGSGKTAFSERVSSFMPGISIISMDNYNDASKLVDSNFDGEATADG